MSLIPLSPPAEEPVSLAEMKDHLRVLHDDEDALIEAAIAAARRAVEARAGVALVSQGWRYLLDRPPEGVIALPLSPVSAVDAVTLIGADDSEIALEPGDYDASTGPFGRLYFARRWAARAARFDAVRIDFTAGWADAEAAPEDLKLAVRMLAAFFYEAREAAAPERVFSTPLAAEALVAPYRRVRL